MLPLLLESAVRSLALGAVVWVALKLLRVRNVHAQTVIWIVVLAASLLMPLAMQGPTVKIPPPRVVRIAPASHFTEIPTTPNPTIPWRDVLLDGYYLVAGILLLRLATGLTLTWRLRQRALPIHDDWTAQANVRSSNRISVPVTFGSTILIPADWPAWDDVKRAAVLLHERSHVERADFYVQILAALHRAVFWFSPLGWWLARRIAELGEATSDDAALQILGDRPSYARILVEFAGQPQAAPAGVAMAHFATVSRRVERILAETQTYARISPARAILLAASIAPLVALAAGCSLGAQAQTHRWNFDDDSEPYVIFSDNSMTMSGSSSDARRAEIMHNRVHGDFIWFENDLKFYVITDTATVKRAQALFAPQEELGRQEEDLGSQQEKLGEEQERLGEKQSHVMVDNPDLSRRMAELRDQIDKLQKEAEKKNKQLSEEDLGDLQGKIGDLQGKIGELQGQAGEKQAKLGEEQSKLGDQQALLGDKQAALGEEQEKLSKEASKKMRNLLDEALRSGLAKKVE